MLHILFLILKIIGIVLLVIIGIVLALVGIVLFVPIRYRIKSETTDALKGLRLEVKATWLCHLISAFVVYKDGELDWKARVAWKNFKANDDKPEIKVEEDMDKEVEPVTEKSKQEKTSQDKTQTETTSQEPITKKKKTTSKEKVNWLEKIKCTIKGICDKIKKIKDFIVEEAHLKALLCLKNELVYFLKKIKPDKLKGYLRFGLEDPYDTGRVLALLSVLYPFYGENIEIYPEFEKEIIEADVFAKGRIHLIHLLIIICKIYFDNNIKVAYKNLKTLKE